MFILLSKQLYFDKFFKSSPTSGMACCFFFKDFVGGWNLQTIVIPIMEFSDVMFGDNFEILLIYHTTGWANVLQFQSPIS